MATITELIGVAYDTLFKRLNLGESAFLQLAWPGIALSPADFKDPASPAGPYDPGYAEETFSFLANIVPTFSLTQFLNSGLEVDDLYQYFISAAIPLGVPLDQLLTNPAYKLFSDAQFEFASARHGSRKDASVFYYPCQATPTDWYTEANAATWATFSMGAGQAGPAPAPGPFTQRGGAALLAQGLWQLKPPATDAAALRAGLQKTLQTRAAALAGALRPAGPQPIYRPLEAGGRPGASPLAGPPAGSLGARLAPALVAGSALGGPDERPALAEATVKAQLRPAPLLSPALLGQASIDPARFEVTDAAHKLPFNAKIILNTLLHSLLVARPVSAASKNFSVSFRYAQVTITRPWLKLTLLSLKNWYLPGTRPGEYATGTPTSNPGLFALLPLSFIAIRDLKISAEWSAEDRANASRAVAFGPFNTQASSLVHDTLEIPGLQILAAVSRLMPMLPPIKDPAHP